MFNLGNIRHLGSREYMPYTFMLAVNLVILALAFVVEKPDVILSGFLLIIQSRSILVTDYIALGGIGATLLNVSIVGILVVLMLVRLGLKPNGANIMALWMSMGFAFFGKNVFNMIPLTCGVWLFSKYRKEPFSNHYLAALLVATLSPTISEVAFLGVFSRPVEITAGILLGFVVGFIFPTISLESIKIHNGYNLYNMGFSGGLIATVLATAFREFGIDIVPSNLWSSGNNAFFAGLLYSISFVLFAFGMLLNLSKGNSKDNIKKSMINFRKIFDHPGRLVTDFYNLYGNSVYINMSLLCAFSTTLVLVLGAEINGPAIAGILTMTGFGSLGKHLKNVAPIVAGAVLSAYANKLNPAAPNNIVAILFSSGLAPLAGMFGWKWGIIAGFLHVSIAMYIGDLNGNLNLYNNGFAACFVVMFLLPVISIFRKDAYKL